jgi:hypothetical protein
MSTVTVHPASTSDATHHPVSASPMNSIDLNSASSFTAPVLLPGITPEPLPDRSAAPVSQLLPHLASGTGIDGIQYRDRLISRQALAHWLGISCTRLGIWARNGYGPTPRRCGGYKLYYVVGEVLDFIHASTADVYPDVRRKTQDQKSENLSPEA